MRIHCLQHVSFEGPAMISGWAALKEHSIGYTRFYEDWCLPALADFDFLVVMGGPMSCGDHDVYPWLKQEEHFIAAAVKANKAVLGICLGAQLLANAMGGRVYPGGFQEIGWRSVVFDTAVATSFGLTGFPAELAVMHWHGDTFDLPMGADHWASSSAYPNQAFVINDRVVGLQFHLEMTDESLDGMIENCGQALVPDRYVHTVEQINANRRYLPYCQKTMEMLLDQLTKNIGY